MNSGRFMVIALGLVVTGGPRLALGQPRPLPFGVGEELRYTLEVGPLKAGSAILTISRVDTLRARPAYYLHSRVESSPAFSLFYTLEDELESWMDMEHLYSLRFRRRVREGEHRDVDELVLDQARHLAVTEHGDTLAIPAEAQDDLSVFYYLRTLELQVGQEIVFARMVEAKRNPLKVKVVRRERVRVPAGTFDCLVVEPSGAMGFFARGGTTLWLTADQRRIPVMMKSQALFGVVRAVLERATPGKEVTP